MRKTTACNGEWSDDCMHVGVVNTNKGEKLNAPLHEGMRCPISSGGIYLIHQTSSLVVNCFANQQQWRESLSVSGGPFFSRNLSQFPETCPWGQFNNSNVCTILVV
mmetsp:Transcript_120069/g.239082  ORF Transcript_120069/g.239082 Transcript_120069/m.239082 type:complete len:106 (-) Transcript_120069:369-686(-)